jgi:hypothetical protein
MFAEQFATAVGTRILSCGLRHSGCGQLGAKAKLHIGQAVDVGQIDKDAKKTQRQDRYTTESAPISD